MSYIISVGADVSYSQVELMSHIISGGADVSADICDAWHVRQEKGPAQEDVFPLPQKPGQRRQVQQSLLLSFIEQIKFGRVFEDRFLRTGF